MSSIQRFFVQKDHFQCVEGRVTIHDPSIAHQVSHVLRLGHGDAFVLCDGEGQEYALRIERIEKDHIFSSLKEMRVNTNEIQREIILYQAVLKKENMEIVLEKGVELGVHRFIPVVTERSHPFQWSDKVETRFQKIMKEAAEVAHRGRVPIVEQPVRYAEAVRIQEAPRFFFSVSGVHAVTPQTMMERIREKVNAEKICLFVGPSGDFTSQEMEEARVTGWTFVHFGPRILRSETAAILACGLVASSLS